MTMRNIALQLVYQGTHFHGYQIQPAQRTVQSELEAALLKLLGELPVLTCAGRTDAGVHAYAQLVNFKTKHTLPQDRWVPALNGMLPPDLRVVQAWQVRPDFNSRYAALARHYRYLIRPAALTHPHLNEAVWQYTGLLDLEALQSAWQSLVGHHNFKAFCKSGSYRSEYEITVRWVQCWQWQELLVLEIMAQSFLYNMVRTLVGTVVDIARGKLTPAQLQQALLTGERQLAGSTAPPQGLYLYHVLYPPEDGLELILPQIHNWPAPWTKP